MAIQNSTPATITIATQNKLSCQGDWTLAGISKLNDQYKKLLHFTKTILSIDVSKIINMDSGGAWQLHKIINFLTQQKNQVSLEGFTTEHKKLFEAIQEESSKLTKIPQPTALTAVAHLGKQTIELLNESYKYLAFVGESAVVALHTLRHPQRLRWRAIFSIVETMGYNALPIIALLSFMIGVVLAYQMGLQLRNYGANIYIVDLTGIAIFREFGPLLTAIMVAGRTGSAFTAQLGTMKVKEEIDALTTMGLTPTELLVLPRLIGLFIAVPLLTIWADIFGVIGGMVMSKGMLDITWYDFITRFQHVITIKSLLLGLGKAPIFALLIASIGCFQGMQVVGSADSVGKQTTRSVVQAIFFIIVADAAFSILFSKFNL